MWPQLINTLGWWQWLILAAVPPAIVALYFLKLKRHPVEVPSTYLWHKSIEDLHVNSIWQRLRRNLLLLLQLLVILLMVLALLRPGWRGAEISGDRFICLIDNSASMQATDVQPNRLEEAKRRAAELIDQMESGDAAMIVSFADTARVEREFTGNRRQLRRALDGIRPTQRSTSLVEALKVASGLANPGRSAEDKSDFQVAEALPAKLFIFSDGKFDNVSGFSLGNLEPIYVPIGQSEAANVGIVALSVRRHPVKVGQLQLFARLENFGAQEVSLGTELFLDDRMIDADRVDIAAGESRGVVFDPGTIDAGVLRLRAATDDYLACDDEALVAVNPPRQAAVLLVTPGNRPLQLALGTDAVREIAEVTVESPAFLKTKLYLKQAGGGTYDLVIYDRCAPKEMPRANSLFIGTLPTKGWKAGPKTAAPVIIDSEHTHPLMQWFSLDDVILLEGTPLEVPTGGSVLIDSDEGPMFVIAPREGFEDAVLAFTLVEEEAGPDGKTAQLSGTNWWIKRSFPVFVFNVLHYLGGCQGNQSTGNVRPGQPVTLDSLGGTTVTVRTPSGKKVKLKRGKTGKFTFTGTAELGAYDVLWGGKTVRRFATNLFDGSESDIRPAADVQIGHVEVTGQSSWEVVRRETWKLLLLLGLAVLLLEWYIYTRRVRL